MLQQNTKKALIAKAINDAKKLIALTESGKQSWQVCYDLLFIDKHGIADIIIPILPNYNFAFDDTATLESECNRWLDYVKSLTCKM